MFSTPSPLALELCVREIGDTLLPLIDVHGGVRRAATTGERQAAPSGQLSSLNVGASPGIDDCTAGWPYYATLAMLRDAAVTLQHQSRRNARQLSPDKALVLPLISWKILGSVNRSHFVQFAANGSRSRFHPVSITTAGGCVPFVQVILCALHSSST